MTARRRKPRRWPKGTAVGADGRGGGRFAPSRKPSEPLQMSEPVAKQVRAFRRRRETFTYPQLDQLLADIVNDSAKYYTQSNPRIDRLLDAVEAEMVRRDREAEHWRGVYEQIEAQHPDWDLRQVYAAAHGLSYEEADAQERRAALLASHSGLNFQQALYREWDLYLNSEIDAFEATGGVYYNPAAASRYARQTRRGNSLPSARQMWTMSPERAYRLASDELKAFWDSRQHGRITFTVFRSWYVPTERARGRAEQASKRGTSQAY